MLSLLMSLSLSRRRNGLDYMHKVYIPPWCRVGPFAVGLVLGYSLFITRGQVRMSKVSTLFAVSPFTTECQ